MSLMGTISFVFLVLFLLVATADGIYFHLWKYRLYARRESLYEHQLHTVRAFLFIPIVFFLYFANFGGIALWAGVFFVALDLIVEMLDVFCENDSRAALGGLTSLEYAAHVAATTFRIASLTLILAAKPLSAWSLSAPIVLSEGSAPAAVALAANVMLGNFLVGVLHLLLPNEKFRRFRLFDCCRQ